MAHAPLLSRLRPINPPSGLLRQVLQTIESARLRTIYTRITLVLVGLALVALYTFGNWTSLWTELRTSPFVEFLRLAASDPDVALANIKDVLLGLLEALPADSLLTLLTSSALAVGLVYLLQMMRDVRRHPHSFTIHSS